MSMQRPDGADEDGETKDMAKGFKWWPREKRWAGTRIFLSHEIGKLKEFSNCSAS